MTLAAPRSRPTPGSSSVDPRRPGPRFHDVRSVDGTRLRAWDNGVDEGPTVLLCNGLGCNPYAWSSLLEPDCGVRLISWMHRGTGGSERPARRDATGIEEFAEDAAAVLDDFGVDSAPVMGWSMGVNTAFELALRHPERVRGILAVGGVPGATFATMLGPLRLPHVVAEPVAVGLAMGMQAASPLLGSLAARIPVGPRGIAVLSRSGFMMPVADPEMSAAAVADFLTTPVHWYLHMALRAAEHRRVPLARVHVPTRFLAGSADLFAGPRDMRAAAAQMSNATYTEIRGSHFLPLEQPDAIHAELMELLATVG